MPSIEKRGNYWSIKWSDNGRQRRQSIDRLVKRHVESRSEADAIYRKWLLENSNSRYDPAPKIRLGDLYTRYRDHAARVWSAESFRVDMPRLQSFILWCGEHGLQYVEQLTPIHIEEWRVSLLDQKMQIQTANKYLERSRAFFNRLKAWRLIERSPMDGIEMMKYQKKEMRVLTDKEIAELLLMCTDEDLRDVVTLALQTGCRQSEIVHLRWSDVRDDDIHIPKTKSYRPRTIPFGPGMRDLIERRRRKRGPRDVFVFDDGTGEPRSGNTWYHRLMGAYIRADIVGADFHTLRHTFASRLVRAGVNLKVVQALMGHSDIKTTLQYVHLYDGDREAAVGKLSLPKP
jgi:integrase/recombinase XerD